MLFIAAIVFGFITTVAPDSCYYQRCLGCHPQEIEHFKGVVKECRPSEWVSPEWLHQLGHPPPATDSRIPIEHRCVKMVATPDNKSFGNTVDVIKGCVPRLQVDSVCVGLVAVERARGHSDARCFICNRNECNFSVREKLNTIAVFISALCYLILR